MDKELSSLVARLEKTRQTLKSDGYMVDGSTVQSLTDAVFELKAQERRIEMLERIIAESYQVIGAMAVGESLDNPSVVKALDNASKCELVHDDVLPFLEPTAEMPVERKLYERKAGIGDCYDSHDTRTGPEDRRLSAFGNLKKAHRRCKATCYGRRHTDRASWATPQPAPENEMLVEWFDKNNINMTMRKLCVELDRRLGGKS